MSLLVVADAISLGLGRQDFCAVGCLCGRCRMLFLLWYRGDRCGCVGVFVRITFVTHFCFPIVFLHQCDICCIIQ